MTNVESAAPDELAALYLRGRDVPCPGCGYNRRDGLTAACPECGRDLHIGAKTSYHLVVKPRLAMLILCGLMVFGASNICFALHLLITTRVAIFPSTSEYAIWAVGVAVPTLTFGISIPFAAASLRRIRRKDKAASRSFSLVILLFAGAQVLELHSLLFWILDWLGLL